LERLAIDLSTGLSRFGDRGQICCLEHPGPLAPQAAAKGITVHALGKRPGVDAGLIFRLAGLIRREAIDVVHTHNRSPLIYGTLAARLAGAKALVHTRHGREVHSYPRFVWSMNRAIVAISEDSRQVLLKNYPVTPPQVQVIHNGIDVPAFGDSAANGLRDELKLRPDAFIIGIIGRIAEEKDHVTLLRAMQQVRQARPDAVLLVIGDGPIGPQVRSAASELGVADVVKFLGFRHDVPALLQLLDVFVLSSTTEGISLTLLEAMAARKPIVATRVGGNPEVVIDGQTGLLVPSKDPQALATAILKVANDPAFRKQLGQAGRVRVESAFSQEQMVAQYHTLYTRLLA
jgi:glycosyltransferase involved in cell wall biosynthesis